MFLICLRCHRSVHKSQKYGPSHIVHRYSDSVCVCLCDTQKLLIKQLHSITFSCHPFWLVFFYCSVVVVVLLLVVCLHSCQCVLLLRLPFLFTICICNGKPSHFILIAFMWARALVLAIVHSTLHTNSQWKKCASHTHIHCLLIFKLNKMKIRAADNRERTHHVTFLMPAFAFMPFAFAIIY